MKTTTWLDSARTISSQALRWGFIAAVVIAVVTPEFGEERPFAAVLEGLGPFGWVQVCVWLWLFAILASIQYSVGRLNKKLHQLHLDMREITESEHLRRMQGLPEPPNQDFGKPA